MNTITQITDMDYLTLENLGFEFYNDGQVVHMGSTDILIGTTLVEVYTSYSNLCIITPQCKIKISEKVVSDEEIKFQLGRYL